MTTCYCAISFSMRMLIARYCIISFSMRIFFCCLCASSFGMRRLANCIRSASFRMRTVSERKCFVSFGMGMQTSCRACISFGMRVVRQRQRASPFSMRVFSKRFAFPACGDISDDIHLHVAEILILYAEERVIVIYFSVGGGSIPFDKGIFRRRRVSADSVVVVPYCVGIGQKNLSGGSIDIYYVASLEIRHCIAFQRNGICIR